MSGPNVLFLLHAIQHNNESIAIIVYFVMTKSLNPCRAQLLIVNTWTLQKYNKFNYPPFIQTLTQMLFKIISHLPQIRHKNHAAGTSHAQYTAYRKHQCHRYDAPINPPPRFRILLCWLVLAKAVSSAFHASRLHRKNKVIIVLAIEIRHEPLLASEALVDEQILTIVGLCFG